MSQKFNKGRNSHSRTLAYETWSPGVGQFLPPKQTYNKPIINQPQNQSVLDQFKQVIDEKIQKNQTSTLTKHRRRQSQNSRIDKQTQHQQIQYRHYPQYVSSQATPKNHRSKEKKQSIADSSKQIGDRFQEIEEIMGVENQNLREQKDYLLKTIYKMQMREKQYKNQILYYKNKALQYEMENKMLKDKYSKAREFISNGIDKMQEAIAKEPSSQSNSNKNTNHQSNECSININQQIQQLDDKFDALMYQYQKTREPSIRKKCMEIAKQLKKLRKIQQQNNFNFNNQSNKKQNSKKQ